jgi:hypothetical protein
MMMPSVAGLAARAGRKRVCVIGAGAAGLAAARRLLEVGIEPTVLERSAEIGGCWAHGEAAPCGAMYPALVTNLPKELMAFHDFPFDRSLPSFVRGTHVAAYLRAYAAAHQLEARVRLRCEVDAVEPCAAPDASVRLGVERWRVRWLEAGGGSGGAPEQHTSEFDGVIVANGHHAVESLPELPGLRAFEDVGGVAMHSNRYKGAAPFAGKRVLVVGARASGTDIARALHVGHAARVLVADPACEVAERDGPIWRMPALDDLGGGADGAHAVFAPRGGRGCARVVEPVDAVVLCTGYRYHFPFLSERTARELGGLEVGRGCVSALHLSVLHCEAPSLALVGLPYNVVPFPLFDAQARLAARVLAHDARADAALPGLHERRARVAEERLARAAAGVRALDFSETQWAYCRELARLGGFYDGPLERRLAVAQALHLDVRARKPRAPGAPDTYRQCEYELVMPGADGDSCELPQRVRVRLPGGAEDEIIVPGGATR